MIIAAHEFRLAPSNPIATTSEGLLIFLALGQMNGY